MTSPSPEQLIVSGIQELQYMMKYKEKVDAMFDSN